MRTSINYAELLRRAGVKDATGLDVRGHVQPVVNLGDLSELADVFVSPAASAVVSISGGPGDFNCCVLRASTAGGLFIVSGHNDLNNLLRFGVNAFALSGAAAALQVRSLRGGETPTAQAFSETVLGADPWPGGYATWPGFFGRAIASWTGDVIFVPAGGSFCFGTDASVSSLSVSFIWREVIAARRPA